MPDAFRGIGHYIEGLGLKIKILNMDREYSAKIHC